MRASTVIGGVIVACMIGLLLQLLQFDQAHSRLSNVDVSDAPSLPFETPEGNASEELALPPVLPAPAQSSATTANNESHATSIINPLNDQSLDWPQDPSVKHLWLQEEDNQPPPPAMLVLTTVGWNHINQTYALEQFRSQRSRQLIHGLLRHPWFHPTAWQDHHQPQSSYTIPNSTRLYVFMDYETCGEKNFPVYGKGMGFNADVVHNRTNDWKAFHPKKPFEQLLLHTPLFQTHPDIHLVVFDCGGHGPEYRFLGRHNLPDPRVNLVSVSAAPVHHLPSFDIGLPPPQVTPLALNDTHLRLLLEQDCRDDRPLLLVFSGNFRHPVRQQMRASLHNEPNGVWIGRGPVVRLSNSTDYADFMKRAVFGAAPRGDNLFSYRFVEVLAAGAIPVVHANQWVWPLAPIIPWTNCCAVDIPEQDVNDTLEILQRLDRNQRCRMRQNAARIYNQYFRTSQGTMEGIMDALQVVLGGPRLTKTPIVVP